MADCSHNEFLVIDTNKCSPCNEGYVRDPSNYFSCAVKAICTKL